MIPYYVPPLWPRVMRSGARGGRRPARNSCLESAGSFGTGICTVRYSACCAGLPFMESSSVCNAAAVDGVFDAFTASVTYGHYDGLLPDPGDPGS